MQISQNLSQKERIDKYEADKNTIADFKDHLKKFVDHLSPQENAKNKPLIFFIDELDRCRPTYAIDLLEKIKHLFDVKGIIFVLAIDKVQIGHSIGSIYGSNMDIDGYLRRFFDLEYRLPDPPRADFCASLYDRFNLPELASGRTDAADALREFIEAFSKISEIFQLSLRTIEQCFARFNIVVRTTPTRGHLLPSLLAFLIALRSRDFQLFSSFSRGTPDMEGVIRLINEHPRGQEYWDSFYGIELEAHYAVSKGTRLDFSKGAEPHRRALEKYGQDNPQGKRAEQILSLITHLQRINAYGGLSFLTRRIELTEQFTLP